MPTLWIMLLKRPLPFFILSLRPCKAACFTLRFEEVQTRGNIEAVILRFIHNDLIGKIYSHIFHSGVVVWVNHAFLLNLLCVANCMLSIERTRFFSLHICGGSSTLSLPKSTTITPSPHIRLNNSNQNRLHAIEKFSSRTQWIYRISK